MGETIRNFQHGLGEPWRLLAGFSPYLETRRKDGVLAKTVFLPYGAIAKQLIAPYGEEAVMVGCVKPLKLAVAQAA